MRYSREYDVIYSKCQPIIGKRKVNGSHRFTEIKVQKMCALHFVKENLQDLQRRPTVNETIKKDGYRKYDHKGTLR